MAITEFKAALNQVATERGIPVEDVLESIRTALASAYRKDYETEIEDVEVILDSDTGEAKILKEGEDVTPSGFGRIAAQTAKQVILQKIRETEKQVIFDEYEDKVGTLVSGHIFRMEGGRIIVDLGKAHGTMPQSEQVETENYRMNQRLKVYVKEVRKGPRGTEIIISRADPEFVKKLFEHEVPEIASGTVVIEEIAREAGSRTKMAVYSHDDKVDPVGSCVGQKGVRVQSIIAELFGEKIDIIPYSPSPEKFIAASLSPARVTEVVIDEEEHKATVTVPEDQQSLAIGKEGQNARLANKLTKWKIDIKGTKGIFDTAEGDEKGQKDGGVVGVWDAAIEKVAQQDQQDKQDIADADVTETAEEAEVPASESIEDPTEADDTANEVTEEVTDEETKENE
jgi:transcription termination/antitermination protein NusA